VNASVRRLSPAAIGTRRSVLVVALLALLVIVGVVAALLLTSGNGRTASSGTATATAPSHAELEQEAAMERRVRKADEARLERDVAADARLLASQGVLRGPILRATCTPTGGGSSTNLSSYDGSYDCLAVNSDRHVPHHGHIVEGVRFVATINFRSDGETFGGE
jgi:hypothetical protein